MVGKTLGWAFLLGLVGVVISTLLLNTNFCSTHVELYSKLLDLATVQSYSKQVCSLVICLHLVHLNLFLQYFLYDKVIVHLYMLCPSMKYWVLCQADCRLVVAVKWNCIVIWLMQIIELTTFSLALPLLLLCTRLMWLKVIQLVVFYYTRKLL